MLNDRHKILSNRYIFFRIRLMIGDGEKHESRVYFINEHRYDSELTNRQRFMTQFDIMHNLVLLLIRAVKESRFREMLISLKTSIFEIIVRLILGIPILN